MPERKLYSIPMEQLRQLINQVYHQFYKVFILFAINYVNDIEVAKDLVQEAYLSIVSKLSPDSAINNVKNYFYTTIRNLCLNYLRHQNVHDKHIDSYRDNQPTPNIEQEIIKNEVKFIMADAIRQLSPQQQNVIKLSMKEFKNEEIATRLNIKVETVKTNKVRAYARLRKILKNFN